MVNSSLSLSLSLFVVVVVVGVLFCDRQFVLFLFLEFRVFFFLVEKKRRETKTQVKKLLLKKSE